MTNVNTDRIDRGFVLGNKVLAAEVFEVQFAPEFSRAFQALLYGLEQLAQTASLKEQRS